MKQTSLNILDKLLWTVQGVCGLLVVFCGFDLIYGLISPTNSLVKDTSFISSLYSYHYGWQITAEQIIDFPTVLYNRVNTIEALIIFIFIIIMLRVVRAMVKSTMAGELFTQLNVKRFRIIIILSIVLTGVIILGSLYGNHLLYQHFEAYSDLNVRWLDSIDLIIEPITLFIFYLLFKKGVALKEENDLTI